MPKHMKDTPERFARDIVAIEKIAVNGTESPTAMFLRLADNESAIEYCGGAIAWEAALFEALGFGSPGELFSLTARVQWLNAQLPACE